MSKGPGGYLIDVPVTLTVAVRGMDLTEEKAKKVARDFADGLAPGDEYIYGYNHAQFDTGVVEITEASLESSREEACEVFDVLEPEEYDDED